MGSMLRNGVHKFLSQDMDARTRKRLKGKIWRGRQKVYNGYSVKEKEEWTIEEEGKNHEEHKNFLLDFSPT